MRAYYFSNLDKKLRYSDNRLIEEGITHEVTFPYTYNHKTFEKPTLCFAGLHGSVKALDALKYAPGEMLWVVDIEGDVDEGEDKICGARRTYLAGFDATELLKSFAKKVALINIEKIKPYCTEEDYDIILRFLNGDENLRSAARIAAARTAAKSAAWSAAWSAAKYAYYAATSAQSAWYAAWYAAWSAAQSAWYAAKSAAAYDEMNKILEEMIEEEFEIML